MEDENISFEDFESAFDDTDDYQTDGAEAAAESDSEEETAEDSGEETEAGSDDGDKSQEEPTSETGGKDAADKQDTEQTFTLKVNKEERNVSLAEMTALAQKGADYDRVKDQLAESRQTNQDLQGRLDKFQDVMDVLEMISKGSNIPIEQVVEQVQLNFMTRGGKSEAEARAEIRATKAEKQLNAYKAQQTQQKAAADDAKTRAQKEIAEFQKDFPDVVLDEALVKKLMSDVQGGMSLTNAYRKMEISQKDAEIAELQRKLAAEKQNKKNRSNSPGSQQDSGGRRVKSEYDEFMEAFE